MVGYWSTLRVVVHIRYPGHSLISEGYLDECPVQNGFGSTVDLTQEGHRWLQKAMKSDDCTMLLAANHELMALDRDQTRPELTISTRFVRRISGVVFRLNASC